MPKTAFLNYFPLNLTLSKGGHKIKADEEIVRFSYRLSHPNLDRSSSKNIHPPQHPTAATYCAVLIAISLTNACDVSTHLAYSFPN